MSNTKPGYFARLLAALCGRDLPTCGAAPATATDEQVLELQATVAGLELDLQERDSQIEQLKEEYAAMEVAKQRVAADAGQGQLEQLFKKLAGPLANLAALAEMSDAGQQVEAADLLSLIRSLEKTLRRAGLESIGRVGETSAFDVACHQRMSGGAVHAGTTVTVQLPGYRLGEKILLKAMVTAAADADRQEEEDGQASCG